MGWFKMDTCLFRRVFCLSHPEPFFVAGKAVPFSETASRVLFFVWISLVNCLRRVYGSASRMVGNTC